ncbi:hypothetical protein QEZ54_16440 [Catellatospora sp. KI3]|uniref:hypothetical protein n=1 Tax=Catellatospora sp. KI3 TaxID=3041620 RepID=UPI002482D52E|nr:hypothetical protein [Catellatospora sp. KI3]MDI1462562.1 hypothetical protein [Catellatospora sp. KI3]
MPADEGDDAMFGLRRKKPHGPDFSDITSESAAAALAAEGSLEKLLLLPPEFGGSDIPPNLVYVPVGIAEVKQQIDLGVVRPLVADGTVTRYTATPEYAGDSFIPIAVVITAHTPGSFTTTINIWGEALQRG